MAGYSSKNLITKLGIKPGMRVIIMRAPKGYADMLAEMQGEIDVAPSLVGRFDFIQYFATSVEQLGAVMPNLASHLEPGGMLWVNWVKQSSPKHTGLTENIVRDHGLRAGLVDTKVLAVSDDWSGLKFVYRLADR